jgi:hypothetical protein
VLCIVPVARMKRSAIREGSTSLHGQTRITLRSIRATKKRKRNADKRVLHDRTGGCGAREASRARLSAFHHGSYGSDRTPPLSSS